MSSDAENKRHSPSPILLKALPEPLIDAGIHVPHNLEFMKLHAHRLLYSDFWFASSLEVKGAALALWVQAFYQEPGGSLPDNDKVLAGMVGLGPFKTGLKHWRRMKAEAMYGFTLCNDGRWYHPFIVESVLDIYHSKGMESARVAKAVTEPPQDQRSKDRLRLQLWRAKKKLEEQAAREAARQQQLDAPTRIVTVSGTAQPALVTETAENRFSETVETRFTETDETFQKHDVYIDIDKDLDREIDKETTQETPMAFPSETLKRVSPVSETGGVSVSETVRFTHAVPHQDVVFSTSEAPVQAPLVPDCIAETVAEHVDAPAHVGEEKEFFSEKVFAEECRSAAAVFPDAPGGMEAAPENFCSFPEEPCMDDLREDDGAMAEYMEWAATSPAPAAFEESRGHAADGQPVSESSAQPADGSTRKPARKKSDAPHVSSADVQTVFEYWQTVMEKPRAKLDSKRAKRIQWALKTYSMDACRTAIDGCRRSVWHMGQNDRMTVFNDITLIFRDADHVERFLTGNTRPRRWQKPEPESRDQSRRNGPVIIDHETGTVADSRFGENCAMTPFGPSFLR